MIQRLVNCGTEDEVSRFRPRVKAYSPLLFEVKSLAMDMPVASIA